MFFCHSIRNILRSWKKSLLFFFLIVMLVLVLCVGVGLSAAIRDFLAVCRDSYTTIARLEYMGASYPDETEYDPGIARSWDAIDVAAIEKNEATESWDASAVALGYIDGMTGLNPLAPYKKNAVLLVKIDGYRERENVYTGVIEKAPYTFYDDVVGKMIYIDAPGTALVKGRYYLLHGEFYFGMTSYRYFKLAPFHNACLEQNGVDASAGLMMIDVTTDEGGYEIPPDSILHDVIDTYAVLNNSVTVNAASNAEALFPFQQGTLYLTEGRYFTQEEYASGGKAVIMPASMAGRLNVEVGDTVRLSIAVCGDSSKNESYWAPAGFAYSDDYAVVGLCNTQEELKNDVFIPKSGAVDLTPNHFTYTLGQAVIDNDMADRFVSEIAPLLPERVRLTVYDQGYSSAARPLEDVLRVALIATGVSAVAGLAITALFGFVFVYRQRKDAVIMRKLGATKRNTTVYFLFGAGCIALAAAAAGVVISMLLSDFCAELVGKAVSGYSATNLLYSNGSLTMVKPVAFSLDIKASVFVLTAAAVFVLAILSCFIFANRTARTNSRRRGLSVFGKGTRSRSLSGGAVKYALLSVTRGYFRSAIPLVVSACAAALLLQLMYTTDIYAKRLDDFNADSTIHGYLTDMRGRQIGGLSIGAGVVSDLYSTGLLSDISAARRESYYYMAGYSNQETAEQPTSFAAETLLNRVKLGPGLIFTNNLRDVPEFYYSTEMTAHFMDGVDASIFGQEDGRGIPNCIVSTAFMEQNAVEAGDVITVAVTSGKWYEWIDLRVVGSYVKAGKEDNIYCPLSYYISPSLLLSGETGADTLRRYSFTSASFTLKSGENLSGFKEYLRERGYSEVNKIHKIRSFLIIEDKSFLSTQSSMSQRMWYIERTFPVIYLAVGLLGGLIPFILIQQRKREIAVMRGQGAARKTAFFSMFLEQALLCAAGTAVGFAGWQVIAGGFTPAGMALTGAYVLCWLIGASVSLGHINNSAVRAILKAEE
jgi:ABC-type lipoprotein release transport system permease subunit